MVGSGILGSMTWLMFSLSRREIEFFVFDFRFFLMAFVGFWALLCWPDINYVELHYFDKISNVFYAISYLKKNRIE